MRVRVLLFAGLRERAGEARFELEVEPDPTLDDVRAALEARHPGLLASAKAAVAVNGAYVRGEELSIREGDEIAFLPPVSGG